MKKYYIQPSVEDTLLTMGANVMAGSPGVTINTTPIDSGEGGD